MPMGSHLAERPGARVVLARLVSVDCGLALMLIVAFYSDAHRKVVPYPAAVFAQTVNQHMRAPTNPDVVGLVGGCEHGGCGCRVGVVNLLHFRHCHLLLPAWSRSRQ